MRPLILVLLIGLFWPAALWPAAARAESSGQNTPPLAAEMIRQRLFEAQMALTGDEPAAALPAIHQAEAQYRADIMPWLADDMPAADRAIRNLFSAASADIRAEDDVALAATRAQIWTALLAASAKIIFTTIEAGDAETAGLWLPLREYRISTRFSRPGADATRALRAMKTNRLAPAEALAAVRADILDTIQAQLNTALAHASLAEERGFSVRQAWEANLAAGYFVMLETAWAEQRGADTLAELRADFGALTAAAAIGDGQAFQRARGRIEDWLRGFRAAPLSEEEQSRRAGQLLRFLALIPIEYGRGVRNGVITNEIEIQEAYSFHEGATAAFKDLQGLLAARGEEITASAETTLAEVYAHIRQLESPKLMDEVVGQLIASLESIMPEAWLDGGGGGDIDVILSVLDQVANAVAQGDYAVAESSRLEAYAILELGVEQRLRGLAPSMAIRIESLFWQGRGSDPGLATLLAQKATAAEVRLAIDGLEEALEEARLALGSGQAAPAAVVTNAAVIVFREGLEAVLILASLLASLRGADQRHHRRPLIWGALLACVLTVITWWAASHVLRILLPLGEVLEAIVSLIAIGVLLLITNWFFHKAYWTGWMAQFHTKKQELTSVGSGAAFGQMMGLVLLGFTSIYREGFETVLFLQSLILEAGYAIVLRGVALGLLGTAVVGVATFVMQVRLPYRRMLIITGFLITSVLVTMIGHTVHVMQAIGWLPIDPVPGLYLPWWMGQWFGAWANWQGLGMQLAAVVFVGASYVLAERRNKRRVRKHLRRARLSLADTA